MVRLSSTVVIAATTRTAPTMWTFTSPIGTLLMI